MIRAAGTGEPFSSETRPEIRQFAAARPADIHTEAALSATMRAAIHRTRKDVPAPIIGCSGLEFSHWHYRDMPRFAGRIAPLLVAAVLGVPQSRGESYKAWADYGGTPD